MPAEMPPEMLVMEWFADSYGWTPDQVGGIPLEYADWYHVVAEAKSRVAKMKQDKRI